MNNHMNNMMGFPNMQGVQMPYGAYTQQRATMPINTQSILKVNGLEGAKAFQMMPNTMVALFDANEDIFYLKTSDAGGFSDVKAYRFTEVVDTPPMSASDFVTRKEFNELKEMINNAKQLIQQTTEPNVKSNADATAIQRIQE